MDSNLLLYSFYVEYQYSANTNDFVKAFMEALNISREKNFYVFDSVRGRALLKSNTNENFYESTMNLYMLVNSSLRTGDLKRIFNYNEYFYSTFAIAQSTSLYCFEGILYRGTKLQRNEIESYKVGQLIVTHDFFSTSKNIYVAAKRMETVPHNKANEKQIIFTIKTSPMSLQSQIHMDTRIWICRS
jgi:hypothetical protein